MTWLEVSVWLFLPAMMLTIGAQGAVVPNNQACFMEYFERHGGTAASLLGACQFGIAGTLSALSTLLPETLGWVIASMLLARAMSIYWGQKINARRTLATQRKWCQREPLF